MSTCLGLILGGLRCGRPSKRDRLRFQGSATSLRGRGEVEARMSAWLAHSTGACTPRGPLPALRGLAAEPATEGRRPPVRASPEIRCRRALVERRHAAVDSKVSGRARYGQSWGGVEILAHTDLWLPPPPNPLIQPQRLRSDQTQLATLHGRAESALGKRRDRARGQRDGASSFRL